MPKQESALSKICNFTKSMTPFCIDMDEEDSYIIDDTPKKSSNHK